MRTVSARLAALLALVLVSSAPACALLAGLGVDYSAPLDAGNDGAMDVAPNDSATEAGPSDAGLSDLVLVDAPVEAGPAGCRDAGYLFCDDFEGPLDQWIQNATNGTVTTDSSFACSGLSSLHVTEVVSSPRTGEIYGVGLLHQAQTPLPADVFVRAFVRITTRPTPDIAFLQLFSGSSGVQEEINSGVYGGENYNFDPYKTWSGPSARLGPCECVEMEVDGLAGHVRVWINGQNLTDTDYGANVFPAFDTVQIGPSVKAGVQPIVEELWVDDFAYNDMRIGCTH
jgi:hypothetical protein